MSAPDFLMLLNNMTRPFFLFKGGGGGGRITTFLWMLTQKHLSSIPHKFRAVP